MNYEIIQGDCLQTMRQLPAGSVQCVVTSPPYYSLRDYQVEGQIGLEEKPEQYVAKLVEVFREVRRVLRDDGVLWLNLGDSYNGGGTHHGDKNVGLSQSGKRQQFEATTRVDGLKPKDLIGIPWRVAFALQADGWYLRSEIIWHKKAPMPESVTDRPTKAHEQVFLLSKSPRYYYDAEAIAEPSQHLNLVGKPQKVSYHNESALRNDGDRVVIREATRNRRSVWTLGPEPYHEAHFATMPTKLVEPCILAGTSAHGCCAACGAPWARVVEKGEIERHPLAKNYQPARMAATAAGQGTNGLGKSSLAMMRKTENLGWQPTCTCGEIVGHPSVAYAFDASGETGAWAAEPVPCTVLDPFSGAATVGVVALKHGRRYIGCELNPDYIALSHDRLGKVQPMLLEAI